MSDFKQIILDEMAHTLLVLAWADYADEHHLARPQTDYADTMPEPADWLKTEAQEKARAIYARIEQEWIKQTHNPYLDVSALITLWANEHGEPVRRTLERWAHDAVLAALGTGAFWEDSHAAITAMDASSWQRIEVEVKSLDEGLSLWKSKSDTLYDYDLSNNRHIRDFSLSGTRLIYKGNTPSDNAEAMDISIAKWTFLMDQHQNGHGTISENGPRTCGLCMLHWTEFGCGACPIKAITGRDGCGDTPYFDYVGDDDEDIEAPERPQELALAAEAELHFLLSVREGLA